MDLTIRLASEPDWPAVVDIYNQSITAGRSTADTVPVTLESRLPWLRAYTPDRRPLWVGCLGDEVIGWVGLVNFYAGRPAYAATAEISLYIATAHHRRGFGERLKRHAIAACPRLGVTTLLSFHFDHNPATIALNTRLGFVPAGHLERIATVNGQACGLMISMLRVPDEPDV